MRYKIEYCTTLWDIKYYSRGNSLAALKNRDNNMPTDLTPFRTPGLKSKTGESDGRPGIYNTSPSARGTSQESVLPSRGPDSRRKKGWGSLAKKYQWVKREWLIRRRVSIVSHPCGSGWTPKGSVDFYLSLWGTPNGSVQESIPCF